jgi:hypothetical protein
MVPGLIDITSTPPLHSHRFTLSVWLRPSTLDGVVDWTSGSGMLLKAM